MAITGIHHKEWHISELLKAYPQATPRNALQTVFEIGLRIRNDTLILRIFLPDQFPRAAPEFSFTNAEVSHPWIDDEGRVIGCNSLYTWDAYHSSLSEITREILNQFVTNPPRIVRMKIQGTNSFGLNQGSSSGLNNGSYSTSSSQNGDENLHLPEIPAHFPELDNLSISQLQDLEKTDASFRSFFNNLEIVKTPLQIKADLEKQNRDQALQNLANENVINQLMYEVEDMRDTADKLQSKYESLSLKQQELQGNLSNAAIFKKLKSGAEEAERESEAIADTFLKKELDLGAFIDTYLEKRKLFHMRHSKYGLMKNQGLS